MHSINPQTITSILMVRHDAVGDMIVALPAMYAIKAHYPNARVTVMVSNYSPNRQIIENEGIADEILVAPSPQSFREWMDVVRMITARSFDMAIHFSNYGPVAWACFWAGVPINVGDTAVMGLWPVFRRWGTIDPPHNVMAHRTRYHFLMLKKLGISATPSPLRLRVTPTDTQTIQHALAAAGRRPNRPMILIHPGANGGNKPVTPDKYIDYIHSLRATLDCDICLSGSGATEAAIRDTILHHVNGGIIDFVGRTTVSELIALVGLASVVVGIDTGPSHMAAALQIPQVLLSTTKRVLPFRWGPWLAPHLVVRQNRRCALVCQGPACPEWTCVTDLPTSEMVSHTLSLLRGAGVRTYADQQRYWFGLCMTILVLYDPTTHDQATAYVDQLAQWDVTAIAHPVDGPHLTTLCVTHDVQIIHNFSSHRRYRLAIVSQLLNRQLSHPPLLIHGVHSFDSDMEMVAFYQDKFDTRGLL